MDIQDSRAVAFKQETSCVRFSKKEHIGKQKKQEDILRNFQDECFVLCDGVSVLPNGREIAELAADTAVWAYSMVRRKPYYWEDKRSFLKRIMRSTNLRVWQKRKDRGFEAGSAATMIVAIIARKSVWVAHVGNSRAYLIHKGYITQLTTDDVSVDGVLEKAIGFVKLGLQPTIVRRDFAIGDMLLLVSDGVAYYLNTENIRTIIAKTADSQESFDFALKQLFKKAASKGSQENMSAWLIKRIASACT